MVAKTKHEFVDDNPYLVYSGDVDTSYDGASESGGGGGGGDAGDSGVFWVEILGDSKNPDNWPINPGMSGSTATLSLSATYDEIKNAINQGKIVKAISKNQNEDSSFNNYIFDLTTYTGATTGGSAIFFEPFMYGGGSDLTIGFYIVSCVYDAQSSVTTVSGRTLMGTITPSS